MEPRTLSASACLVFEGCEARYKATYIERTPELSGSAANLGTACHEALQHWVEDGHHFPRAPFSKLEELFGVEYDRLFATNDRKAEGVKMLRNWYDRSGDDYWEGRTVISTEDKLTFDLKTSKGVLPFTYIIDRCDRLDDGTIDIIDYKSVSAPVQPEEMKERIQPRAYALAAQIAYPDASGIWMSFDLLRYDIVGAKFDRDENVQTWKYLQNLAEKIYESDGTRETLNPECRWCVRAMSCETMQRHVSGGGVMSVTTLEDAANRRAELEWKRNALSGLLDQLDEYILDEMAEQEMTDLRTNTTEVKITASARREADSERIIKVIGPDLASRYGKIGVTDLDKIIKEEDLTDDQKSQLRQLVRKKFGKARIKTKSLTPFAEDI